MDGWID